MVEFIDLRDAAQQRANAVRAASERKATPDEACKLLGVFTDAEAKIVRYVEKNAASCGIPAEAVENMRTAHGKSLALRQRVCTAGLEMPRPLLAPPVRDDRLYPGAPASWDAALLPESKGY